MNMRTFSILCLIECPHRNLLTKTDPVYSFTILSSYSKRFLIVLLMRKPSLRIQREIRVHQGMLNLTQVPHNPFTWVNSSASTAHGTAFGDTAAPIPNVLKRYSSFSSSFYPLSLAWETQDEFFFWRALWRDIPRIPFQFINRSIILLWKLLSVAVCWGSVDCNLH